MCDINYIYPAICDPHGSRQLLRVAVGFTNILFLSQTGTSDIVGLPDLLPPQRSSRVSGSGVGWSKEEWRSIMEWDEAHRERPYDVVFVSLISKNANLSPIPSNPIQIV